MKKNIDKEKQYFLARHYEYLFIVPITLDMEVWLSENRNKYTEEAKLIDYCLMHFDFEGKELYECDNNIEDKWMLNPEFDLGEVQYNIMVPYNCWEIINGETYNIEYSEIWEDFLKDSLT